MQASTFCRSDDVRCCDLCGKPVASTPPTPATEEPWEGPLTDKENAMLEAAWQKHKDAAPPTPATEEREAVALEDCPIGLFISRYGSLCLKTEYGDNNGRIDAYIVSSGEMFWGDPPQTVASQRASMVTPVDYAAEILAAEANERARIAILLEALVDISKAAMIAKAMCDDADREPWQMIADRARKAIDAHLGRNEHGEGK